MATTCPSCGTRYGDNERLCPRDGAVLDADRAPEMAAVGRVLDGKYRLDAFLSRGGMGAVYEATHVMLNRKVAVKLISPALVTSQDMVRRFQREARAVTHLNHPNIVRVHDLGQTADGSLYIAMDLIAGDNLAAVIERVGRFEPSRIVHILGQVVSALAHAHEHGIVHRDLKPQNIMIGRGKDGREVATLLDFGIAKTFEVDANTQVTSTGFAVGTPQYMSPEQAGAGPVDARSDLYSAGVILYQMLVGEPPFTDASTPAILVKHLTETPVPPSVKRPDRAVSPGLERIAMRCLEKKPEARFQSAGELLQAFEAVQDDDADVGPTVPVAVPRTTGTVPPVAPVVPARRRWPAYAAAVAVIALVAAIASAVISRSSERDRVRPPAPAAQPQSEPAQAPPPAVPPQKTADVVEPPPAPVQKTPPPAVVQQRIAPDRPETDRSATARGQAEPQQGDAAFGLSPMSRALNLRVRTLLAERKLPMRRFRGANLEVAARPSGAGRELTADYVVTVRTPGGERRFTGSHSAASETALRREVIEKAATEIVGAMARIP